MRGGKSRLMLFGMVATIVLGAASTAASADPVKLICHLGADNSWKEDEPTIIELNEAQGSVVEHDGARTLPINGTHIPAYSTGPLAATFTADTISYTDQAGNPMTINRLTGMMEMHLKGGGSWTWSCEAGKAKF